MNRSFAFGMTLLLTLAACTGGSPPMPSPSRTPSPVPHLGGEAMFGAEQWPECLNPITVRQLSMDLHDGPSARAPSLPIGAYSSTVYGLFFNMNDWCLAST